MTLKSFLAWSASKEQCTGDLYSKNNLASVASYLRTGSIQYASHDKKDLLKRHLDEYKTLIDSGIIRICGASDFTAESLITQIECTATLDKEKTGLILIDYAQLLYLAERNDYTKRNEELKKICLDLKNLAVRHNLTIILAAQFNREVTSPHNLHMTNMADSADIERAASVIIGLWNGDKEAFGSNTEKKSMEAIKAKAGIEPETMYLKILKNRIGPSELWATYAYNGNNRFIDRKPLVNSQSPRAPEAKQEATKPGQKKTPKTSDF